MLEIKFCGLLLKVLEIELCEDLFKCEVFEIELCEDLFKCEVLENCLSLSLSCRKGEIKT